MILEKLIKCISSIIYSHPRSSATRCQRLSYILCAQLSVMLTDLLFYQYAQGN